MIGELHVESIVIGFLTRFILESVAGSGLIHQFTVPHTEVGVFIAAVSAWITAVCVTTVWYITFLSPN